MSSRSACMSLATAVWPLHGGAGVLDTAHTRSEGTLDKRASAMRFNGNGKAAGPAEEMRSSPSDCPPTTPTPVRLPQTSARTSTTEKPKIEYTYRRYVFFLRCWYLFSWTALCSAHAQGTWLAACDSGQLATAASHLAFLSGGE